MVSGTYDKNTAYDRGEFVAGRCCGGNSGRTCSAEQPQSGNGQHGGQQATPAAAEQGRYGRPVSNFPLDRSLPETGLCGSWHGLPQRKGRFQFCTGSAGTASAGTAGKAGGSRHDRCTHSLNGGGNPECGQILLYQPHGTVQAGEGGRPSRRDPYQTVGENRQQHGIAGYAGRTLAEI